MVDKPPPYFFPSRQQWVQIRPLGGGELALGGAVTSGSPSGFHSLTALFHSLSIPGPFSLGPTDNCGPTYVFLSFMLAKDEEMTSPNGLVVSD